MAAELGQFAPHVASWRRLMASMTDDKGRWGIFDSACHDLADYVTKGLDRAAAVDVLDNLATAYGLTMADPAAVQQIMADAFAWVEEPDQVPDPIDEPSSWPDGLPYRNGNGQAEPMWPPKEAAPSSRPRLREEDGLGLAEWDAGNDPGPIPPRQWLLASQFCLGFISSIVAAGGVGKTALRMLQLISLATGRPLCGQHVFRRCRVLLVSLEDDDMELQRRIEAVLVHYSIPRSELKGWLFCATPKLAKLAEMNGNRRQVGPLEAEIRNAIERRKPDLVSLDPFIKTHGLEENDSGDMDFVCDLLARMAVRHNIAVDSPHHVHKGQVTPGDANSGRGSSGIRDAGRLVYTLTPMADDEANSFNIHADERTRYVRLDTAKVNIAPRSAKASWFRLVSVPIGNVSNDYPNGDTIQVAEPWNPPDTWANLSADAINAVLNDIECGLDNGQRYSNAPRTTHDRAAWSVIQKHCPAKPEAQCRTIIHAWLDSGLLLPRDYDDPVARKNRTGLYVDNSKRPTGSRPGNAP